MLIQAAYWLSMRTTNPHRTYRTLLQMVPVRERKLSDWYNSTNVFFIVSTGRAGSAWLATLLDRDPTALIEHEPVPQETRAHREAIHNPDSAHEYVRSFRKREIYLRAARHHAQLESYGEVNGILRRHIDAICAHIPHATLLHLVRDGRDFVRSIVSRRTYSGKHFVYGDFSPPVVDEYSSRWADLSEFEKACWVWQCENKHMREKVGATVRFEDILSSYKSFCTFVTEPLGLSVQETLWQKSVNRPRNVTVNHKLGHWSEWTSEQRRQFEAICGDEMREYDYPLS